MRYLIPIFAFLLAGSVQALTVDFEDLAGPDGPIIGAQTVTQGFAFSAETTNANPPQLIRRNDFFDTTGVSLQYCPWCTLSMERTDSSTFSIFSVDLASTDISSDPITITGYLDGGGTIEKVFAPAEAVTFETVLFDNSWTNLISIEFGSSAALADSIDNVVVTPIPATLWLFGSALAGLGWIRRKKIG